MTLKGVTYKFIEMEEEDDHVLAINILAMCPVCDLQMPLFLMVRHAVIEHPFLAAAWLCVYFPDMSEDEIVQWIQTIQNEEEDNEYERLVELCEHVGVHYVGVDNVNAVAPIVNEEVTDACPICIELVPDKPWRRIHRCGHMYCASCIETWLEKHKTCPVCKTDVTDQIASISTSESTDGSAGCSTSSPTNMT